MTRAAKILVAGVGVLLLAFVAGFVLFASRIAYYAPSQAEQADAIVVLTGGEQRLVEGARLLSEKRGGRLLISGANPITSPDDLRRKSGLSAQAFDCCVDVGYAAHDTSGNADETKAWARAKRFSRLIIVTSSYHMPRSLTELARAMPGVALLPHPVLSRRLKPERWWTHAITARVIFTEYVKFLPSAARYAAARMLRWDGNAFAGQARQHP